MTAVATNVNYNAAGLTTEIDYGVTDKDVYTFDPYTELMNGFTFTLGTTSLVGTPTWNANRTLKQLAITDGFNATNTQTCNFNPTDHTGTGYDDVGRLVGVYCANGGTVRWTQTYGYDQYDNFSKSGTTNWSPGYSSTTNHITGASYDSDGQVTYDLNNSFSWDGYHKMSAAEAGASLGSCGGAGVFCYTYDAFGRMVEKNNAGTFTEYLYSPMGLTAIMSGQTANAFRAPIPGGALFTNNGSGSIVSHMDWQGSARLAATLGHSVSRDTSYSPYGEDYGNSGTGVVQFFAGMYSDNDSNVLFDTPNRQFDVSSGSRWLSPDPARASWNAYAYPTNPNSFIDPSGLGPQHADTVDARGSQFNDCFATPDCTTYMINGMVVSPAAFNAMILAQGGSGLQNAFAPGSGIGPASGIPGELGDWQYETAQFKTKCAGFFTGCGPLIYVSGGWQFIPSGAANNGTFLGWDANAWRAFRSSLFSWKNFSAGFKEGGCFSQFAEEAFDPADAMGMQDQAIKATAQSGAYVAATAYAANQGLVVPMRSSIVRGILDFGETLGESVALGATVYSEGKALVNEVKSFQSGQCQ